MHKIYEWFIDPLHRRRDEERFDQRQATRVYNAMRLLKACCFTERTGVVLVPYVARVNDRVVKRGIGVIE